MIFPDTFSTNLFFAGFTSDASVASLDIHSAYNSFFRMLSVALVPNFRPVFLISESFFRLGVSITSLCLFLSRSSRFLKVFCSLSAVFHNVFSGFFRVKAWDALFIPPLNLADIIGILTTNG